MAVGLNRTYVALAGIAEGRKGSRCQLFTYVNQVRGGGTLAGIVSISTPVILGINSEKASISYAFVGDTRYSKRNGGGPC